jgi:hypothetical protein
MLVSDLAEAEGGRSGEKTLIDRESITAEISHDTIRWICAAGIKLWIDTEFTSQPLLLHCRNAIDQAKQGRSYLQYVGKDGRSLGETLASLWKTDVVTEWTGHLCTRWTKK